MIKINAYRRMFELEVFLGGNFEREKFPQLITLDLPGVYKVLGCSVFDSPLKRFGIPGRRHFFEVQARVQDGPSVKRRFLLMVCGDTFPRVLLSHHDLAEDKFALQWSFWQATNLPTPQMISSCIPAQLHAFDVSNFVGLELDGKEVRFDV